jgi:hypothetical protein
MFTADGHQIMRVRLQPSALMHRYKVATLALESIWRSHKSQGLYGKNSRHVESIWRTHKSPAQSQITGPQWKELNIMVAQSRDVLVDQVQPSCAPFE